MALILEMLFWIFGYILLWAALLILWVVAFPVIAVILFPVLVVAAAFSRDRFLSALGQKYLKLLGFWLDVKDWLLVDGRASLDELRRRSKQRHRDDGTGTVESARRD